MLAHHQKKKSTVKPGDGNVGRLFSTGKIVFKKQFRSTQQVKDYFFDSFQEAKNQADSEVIHFAKPSDQNQHPESKHLGGYKELLESGWWGTVLEPPKMKKKKKEIKHQHQTRKIFQQKSSKWYGCFHSSQKIRNAPLLCVFLCTSKSSGVFMPPTPCVFWNLSIVVVVEVLFLAISCPTPKLRRRFPWPFPS